MVLKDIHKLPVRNRSINIIIRSVTEYYIRTMSERNKIKLHYLLKVREWRTCPEHISR